MWSCRAFAPRRSPPSFGSADAQSVLNENENETDAADAADADEVSSRPASAVELTSSVLQRMAAAGPIEAAEAVSTVLRLLSDRGAWHSEDVTDQQILAVTLAALRAGTDAQSQRILLLRATVQELSEAARRYDRRPRRPHRFLGRYMDWSSRRARLASRMDRWRGGSGLVPAGFRLGPAES